MTRIPRTPTTHRSLRRLGALTLVPVAFAAPLNHVSTSEAAKRLIPRQWGGGGRYVGGWGGSNNNGSGGRGFQNWWIILLVVVVIIVAGCIIFVVYRRRQATHRNSRDTRPMSQRYPHIDRNTLGSAGLDETGNRTPRIPGAGVTFYRPIPERSNRSVTRVTADQLSRYTSGGERYQPSTAVGQTDPSLYRRQRDGSGTRPNTTTNAGRNAANTIEPPAPAYVRDAPPSQIIAVGPPAPPAYSSVPPTLIDATNQNAIPSQRDSGLQVPLTRTISSGVSDETDGTGVGVVDGRLVRASSATSESSRRERIRSGHEQGRGFRANGESERIRWERGERRREEREDRVMALHERMRDRF